MSDWLSEIGFIITVHERPALAQQCIDSVLRFYPSARIYVCDDSRERTQYEGVTNVHPGAYDIGVSAKRNVLVEAVQEALVMLLEEDFVFTPHTDVRLFYDALQALPDVGMAGAPCCSGRGTHSMPKTGVRRVLFTGMTRLAGPVQKLQPPGKLKRLQAGNRTIRYHEADFVPNFLLAYRDTLLACPWDEDLKIAGEHIEHMTRLSAIRGASDSEWRRDRDEANAEQYRKRLRGEIDERADGKTEIYALATFRNKKHFRHRQAYSVREGERVVVPTEYAVDLEKKGLAISAMRITDAKPMPVPDTGDVPLGCVLLPDGICGHDRQHTKTYRQQRYRDHIQLNKDKMGIHKRVWTRGNWNTYPHSEPDWSDPSTHVHS